MCIRSVANSKQADHKNQSKLLQEGLTKSNQIVFLEWDMQFKWGNVAVIEFKKKMQSPSRTTNHVTKANGNEKIKVSRKN